jgi:hypothetical protein
MKGNGGIDYEYEPNSNLFQTGIHDRSIPVNKRMKKCEEMIKEIREDITDNIKNGSIMRAEIQTLDHKTKEKCNELTKLILDDLHNFDIEFKKVRDDERAENDFFRQQISSLIQDKMKIKQLLVEMKVVINQCEVDIGVNFNY